MNQIYKYKDLTIFMSEGRRHISIDGPSGSIDIGRVIHQDEDDARAAALFWADKLKRGILAAK